ncbi:MAG: cyclic nucleotide-binding domain-containing protein [Gammaproteobacteria bacterium]|nr:cyclic nucleotide-binding domain-containing protein [Gammaproteobacteria bacterium]
MSETAATRYRIAVVGSGPSGLSAACRAAETGTSHVLLEAKPHLSDTVFQFQKGKHVMAEPSWLPLRASSRFEAGSREKILAVWAEDAVQKGVNVRYRAEVGAIVRDADGFQLTLKSGEQVLADHVVLCVGVQGNPNRMKVPGEDRADVQYQLTDPKEYSDEVIVVIGVGDAAIENALALAGQNTVHIVNRGAEISRAKEGNVALITAAIDQGRVQYHVKTVPERIDDLPAGDASGRRMLLRLNSADGPVDLPCDRVIARLGAAPQRGFVEACGIEFPSQDPASLPQVSATYESNVPGLYILGALAGYPLIRQAMNQGYEVVETICGRHVEPADVPVLKERFSAFAKNPDVDTFLDILPARAPILAALNRLQLREFLIESKVYRVAAGTRIYAKGSFADSMYIVVAGEVQLQSADGSKDPPRRIKAGKVFGEVALLSGRPRLRPAVAGEGCVLVEVPRRTMLKLIASSPTVQRYIDRSFCARALERYLLPGLDDAQLRAIVDSSLVRSFKAREPIYAAGDTADRIHLIRSGSVMLFNTIGGREVILQYCAAGEYFGEIDVIAGSPRAAGARAAIKTEILSVDAAAFLDLLNREPALRETVRNRFRTQLQQRLEMERSPERGERVGFLLREGLGEATDALLIDEALCVRCDQCEKACAATHGNVSRLNREAGATFDNLHVPTSCRHCEHPHCMKDCPPNAIRRQPSGEVVIESTCIGCGNCERNCPYGVIQMGVETPADPRPQRSLWQWMMFGLGDAPGTDNHHYPKDAIKKAVKCDMCGGRKDEGPACVQACPTGAAIRVSPQQFFDVLSRGDR